MLKPGPGSAMRYISIRFARRYEIRTLRDGSKRAAPLDGVQQQLAKRVGDLFAQFRREVGVEAAPSRSVQALDGVGVHGTTSSTQSGRAGNHFDRRRDRAP